MSKFDDLDYTKEALATQLGLIELHSTDGSAEQAGCSCIEEKHLLLVGGLATEGARIATNPKEKQFYSELGDLARKLRKTIVDQDFEMPHNPIRSKSGHVFPSCEKKIEKCVLQVKEKEGCNGVADCPVNPYAVCRASIKCP